MNRCKNTSDDPIQTKPIPITYTINMLDMNVSVDDYIQSFATPIEHNHSAIEYSTHFLLRYDTLQYQHNTKTNITHQEIPPFEKYYLCFQTDCKTSYTAQCAKSR